MKTKRVNEKFHRLDVKMPISVYEQISGIAVNSFDAKIHHISHKPELTPTLIYLLELGIESFINGNELVKKFDTDNDTDNIPITESQVKELIKNTLLPLQSEIYELKTIFYRVTNTDNNTDNFADNNTDNNTDNFADNNTDNDTDTLAVELITNTDKDTDNDTDTLAVELITNTDNDTDNFTDTLAVELITNTDKDTDNFTDNDTDNDTKDVTIKSTLSESPRMPLKENTFMINPEIDHKGINYDVMQTHTDIGTFKDAIDNIIIPQLKKGTRQIDIVKMLDGNYKSSINGKSTKWAHTHITRAVKDRELGKV